jgi:uncharacterized protein
MKVLHIITSVLVIIGGLNWGLVVFDFNLVSFLFGSVPVLEKTVYALVGLSAVYLAATMATYQSETTTRL